MGPDCAGVNVNSGIARGGRCSKNRDFGLIMLTSGKYD